MDINKAFDILMEFEGDARLVNNPADKGGLTKYGISQAAYPKLDITNLTKDEARLVYVADYWNTAGCPKLKPGLQYIHFDTAVNMGNVAAVKILQQAAGINADGVVGPVTIEQSKRVSAEAYLLLRMVRYARIVGNDPSQLVFLKGWANRVEQLYARYRAGELD